MVVLSLLDWKPAVWALVVLLLLVIGAFASRGPSYGRVSSAFRSPDEKRRQAQAEQRRWRA